MKRKKPAPSRRRSRRFGGAGAPAPRGKKPVPRRDQTAPGQIVAVDQHAAALILAAVLIAAVALAALSGSLSF